jgi:hypothetical protein
MKKDSPVKYMIIPLLLSVIINDAGAQIDTLNNPDQFVFKEFYVGVARMKNGEKVILDFNYNIVTEKMVFRQKGQIYDITNQSLIDTVYIQGRKFIPAGKVFHEVMTDGKATLLVQHKGSIKPPSRPAAYGGTSEVSSSTYINNIRLGNDRYRKTSGDKIVILPGPLFWIRKNGEMNLITGKRSIMKIFADRKSEVRQFMNRGKFDTTNPDHLNNLVKYYNSLP